MLAIYICPKCQLLQIRNPVKVRNDKECPVCKTEIMEAHYTYAEYCHMSLEERNREMIVFMKRYGTRNVQEKRSKLEMDIKSSERRVIRAEL